VPLPEDANEKALGSCLAAASNPSSDPGNRVAVVPTSTIGPLASVATPASSLPIELTLSGMASAPTRLDSDPEGALLGAELRRRLVGAVDELPPAQRAVITLRDIVGMPADEVCDVLDIGDGNQRVLLHRARTHVRLTLTEGPA